MQKVYLFILSFVTINLKILYIPAKSFKYTEKTYCSKMGHIQSYRSLRKAQEACSANSRCDLITDRNCGGRTWWTCNGNAKRSSRSCTWKKIGNFIVL